VLGRQVYSFLTALAERPGRADPPEGHASDLGIRRRARPVDARAVGQGRGVAAAIAR
jgi:hypothetical protein